MIAVVLMWGLIVPLNSQTPQLAATVFQNVRIFDGKGGQLAGPSHVFVRGNRIERISSAPIAAPRAADTTLIDGGGRTLMPGLIDMHWHTIMVRLAMSGKRNPYPGTLGVVEEGALADILLVDGNPIADITLIENPVKNFVLIMKDGKIYKNTLPRQ
jgi:imidazolonepropionase-like amidohydrolase